MHRVRPALARRYLSTQTQAPAATSVGPVWKRPLAPGRIPAYDEALLLIQRDAEAKRAQLEELCQSKPEGWGKKVAKLEIESEVNLPEVRWRFRKGNSKF
jgi:large subunit ribosomal protein L35